MDPDAVSETTQRLVELGGARAEIFFISQGLGQAYTSVGKYHGILKHVNEALLEAERHDRLEEVLNAARHHLGLPAARSRARSDSRAVTVSPVPRAPSPVEPGRLFISHASVDKAIADALADLLRLGTDLQRDRILCTSLAGMGIPVGVDDYVAFLRTQLQGAALVLPLMTPSFFESQVCLVELGAMWGMELPAFPMVVPPATFAHVEALLGKVQCARIDERPGLARLRDRIVKDFQVDAPTDLWEEKLEQFMLQWERIKSDIAGSSKSTVE